MKYLHIGFSGGTQPTQDAMDSLLRQSSDWLRYSPSAWIVYTNQSQNWWTDQLRLIKAESKFLIFEISPATKWGWADKWIWEWLDGVSGRVNPATKQLPR
jgi:hypothetical protein